MISDFYSMKWLRAKVYEPQQRNKDGMRWIAHRFPIKGGISMRDVMLREACRRSAVFDRIVKKNWQRA